jgi:hypothetical protein
MPLLTSASLGALCGLFFEEGAGKLGKSCRILCLKLFYFITDGVGFEVKVDKERENI